MTDEQKADTDEVEEVEAHRAFDSVPGPDRAARGEDDDEVEAHRAFDGIPGRQADPGRAADHQ